MNGTDLNFISTTKVYTLGVWEPTHLPLHHFAPEIILSECQRNPANRKLTCQNKDQRADMIWNWKEDVLQSLMLHFLQARMLVWPACSHGNSTPLSTKYPPLFFSNKWAHMSQSQLCSFLPVKSLPHLYNVRTRSLWAKTENIMHAGKWNWNSLWN